MADLGRWLSDSYRVPGEPHQDERAPDAADGDTGDDT